ncbi:MAG: hypothetical protein GVY08_00615 [Bacteroidetes bacterium]|jgi:hypothetical protein|nr:hypothetical protein [Bacteroidota bacterium]
MILKSSEIRWFAQEDTMLRDFFNALPGTGEEIYEGERTDYYLKSGTETTGIKVREGNHELKVKCAEDEALVYGTLTHWIKWSVPETKHILNTIADELLTEWIPVKKKRVKKTYEIVSQSEVVPADDGMVDEGVGVEFTNIYLGRMEQPFYTAGFESFSATGQQRENLLQAIKILEPDLSRIKDFNSRGYPAFLKSQEQYL